MFLETVLKMIRYSYVDVFDRLLRRYRATSPNTKFAGSNGPARLKSKQRK